MLKDQQKEKDKKVLITLKIDPVELETLKANAKKYAKDKRNPDGNLSFWLRYAGLNHEPKPSELAPKKKKK